MNKLHTILSLKTNNTYKRKTNLVRGKQQRWKSTVKEEEKEMDRGNEVKGEQYQGSILQFSFLVAKEKERDRVTRSQRNICRRSGNKGPAGLY